MVKVFRHGFGGPNGDGPVVGTVAKLTPNGVVIAPHDGGKPFVAQRAEIEEDKSVARLDESPSPAPDTPKAPATSLSPEQLKTPPANMRPATPEDRKRLKIPPSWQNVHVANDPTAPLQGWGQDSKGRVQPRYTAEHHAQAADKKFARLKQLHDALPALDAALERDAPNDGTAACVLLIRKTGIRNGSDKDTGAENFAYGASNLRAKHVRVEGDKVTLDFIGKEGVHQVHEIHDPFLKQILRDRVMGLGPEDKVFGTNESKTVRYLQKTTGKPFKIHDLRTYLANQAALQAMEGFNPPETLAEYRALRLQVARIVSEVLGNKPQQALASYINPAVFAKWQKDSSWSK